MTSVLLIYPYFKPLIDRSVFRFPPLGPAYIASALKNEGHDVHILDCTFLGKQKALKKALEFQAEVVGIYCMSSMFHNCVYFAKNLRTRSRLLIAGGPLPTCEPIPFLDYFDVVVQGEGEQTMVELLDTFGRGSQFDNIRGIVMRKNPAFLKGEKDKVIFTAHREVIRELDKLSPPARELLPNRDYIQSGKNRAGYSITTVMSTRGCPNQCEFCSNVIFGGSYRERSPQKVVDEIEAALQLGYERISFADDVFTLNKNRVNKICTEIIRRELHFYWECLGRVDSIDEDTVKVMKKAGCFRIFFGIESGNDQILNLMKKDITILPARNAVEIASRAGIQVGAFFILFYPGDTEESVLDTIRFATSLPLDYLGLTLPFLLPGTALLKRITGMVQFNLLSPEGNGDTGYEFNRADFSKLKMKLGMVKGRFQFEINKRFGEKAPAMPAIFERFTDLLFKLMK
jgi:anaerobic magnesium-protoporphyrin IX monomethyl ester cyclase